MSANLPIRQVLINYANKTANDDMVVRALMSHTGWFVPIYSLDAKEANQAFDKVIIFSTEAKIYNNQLWIFTDEQAARTAAEKVPEMGQYVGPVPGIKVFKTLNNRFASVEVNPGSPRPETWFIGNEAFTLAHIWACAVELEQALLNRQQNLLQLMRDFPGYFFLINKEARTPVYITMQRTSGNFAAAFTAPDHWEAFFNSMPPQQRAQFSAVNVSGTELFNYMQQMDVAGLAINSDDPQNSVIIPKDLFQAQPRNEMVTIQDENCVIRYSPSFNYIRVDFDGFFTADQFKAQVGSAKLFELIADKGMENILINLTPAQRVGTEDLDHLEKVWCPAVAHLGIKRVSIVTSSYMFDMFVNIYNGIEAKMSNSTPQMRFFRDTQFYDTWESVDWFN